MRRALWMASGVLLWAAHFAVVYGYTGLACARGWPGVAWTVGSATLLAAAGAAFVILRGFARRAEFTDALAMGLAAFALVAILWEGVSVALVAPCVSR